MTAVQKNIVVRKPLVYYSGYDLYGSIQLDDVNVKGDVILRDTKERFQKFHIDSISLKGKTLLDLGCNLGHLLFEASKYNPKISFGLDSVKSIILKATEIALAANLTDQIKFIVYDLNYLTPDCLEEITGFSSFEVVFACAIDFYIKDKTKFYSFLSEVTSEVLYFEPNSPELVGVFPEEIQRLKDEGTYEHLDTTTWRGGVRNSADKVVDLLKSLGFNSVEYYTVSYRRSDNRFRRVFIARR